MQHTNTLWHSSSFYFIFEWWNHWNSECPNTQLLIIPYCVYAFVGARIRVCAYASRCWIVIVFPGASDRAIWQRAQGGEANADQMSRRAGRIEKCIGTVMCGDGPMSPWGIRVLSCSGWWTPARPHPSTSFPPPTIYLSFSHLNNSPCGCMGSRLKPDKPAMGVIDFSSIPSSGGDGNGGRSSESVCCQHTHTWYWCMGELDQNWRITLPVSWCLFATVDNQCLYRWWRNGCRAERESYSRGHECRTVLYMKQKGWLTKLTKDRCW